MQGAETRRIFSVIKKKTGGFTRGTPKEKMPLPKGISARDFTESFASDPA